MEIILNTLIENYKDLKDDDYIKDCIDELFYQTLKKNKEFILDILLELILYLETINNDILSDYFNLINRERDYFYKDLISYSKFFKVKDLDNIKNFYKKTLCKE